MNKLIDKKMQASPYYMIENQSQVKYGRNEGLLGPMWFIRL